MTALATILPAQAVTSPAIARVAVLDCMNKAESAWRGLETAPDSLLTPYQRFDFLAAWQRQIGTREGVVPAIVVGFDVADRPVCLWPLGVETKAGVKIARFLGGKHSNFNSPISRRQFADMADANALAPILDRLAGVADALILLNQPYVWQGIANPLRAFPHSAAADHVMSGSLDKDFESLMHGRMSAKKRKGLRNRTRALAHHGNIEFRRAECPTQARIMLSTFLRQKAERMKEFGATNAFAADGVAEFLEQCTVEHGVIEIYALYVGDRIAATCGGILASGRFSAMFSSIARDEMAQGSPGRVLLMNLVEHLCERGVATFDLGIGEMQYKDLFCDTAEPLFDSFLPLSASGRMIASATAAVYAAKRTVKQTPLLWSAVKTARRWQALLK